MRKQRNIFGAVLYVTAARSCAGLSTRLPVAAVDDAVASSSEAVICAVSTCGLTVGSHTLDARACSTAGTWGPARAMPIEVLPSAPGWVVSAAEGGFGLTTDTAPTIGTF